MTGRVPALVYALWALAGCGLQPVELLSWGGGEAVPPGSADIVLGEVPQTALAQLRAAPDSQGEVALELIYPTPPELVLPSDLAPIGFEWQLAGMPKDMPQPPPPPAAMGGMAGMPAPPPDPMKADKAKAAADPVTAYELRALGEHADIRLYVSAARAAFPPDRWLPLLRQHIDSSVQIQLRAVRTSGKFVHANALELQVRATLQKGAFYSFSTTAQRVMRGELSRTREAALAVPAGQSPGCYGCHVASRDGKRLLAAVGGGSSLVSWPLTKSGAVLPLPADDGATGYAFGSFDGLAARIARIQGGRLSIFNADTGVRLAQSAAPLRAAVEALDWSPDGRSIALVLQADKEPDAAKGSSLAQVGVALDGSLSAPELLFSAAKDESLLWPAYSPDGAWIAFEKRKGPVREAREARLFLIHAQGGGEPIELAALRDKPMGSASAPAFIEDTPGRAYLIFSAHRPVGSFMPAEGQRQLFAAALDLTWAETGKDPSHAPFWLPFQQRTSSYLSARWAPELQPCIMNGTDDDCDGIADSCVPAEQDTCGNQADDDCDGVVDEGCDCTFRELCGNQKDDDCDLRTDEQPCMPAPPGK